MRALYAAFLAEITRMIQRFIAGRPKNFVEEAVFDMISIAGVKIADFLQEGLDRLRGLERGFPT